jgi:hypothetical protein
MVPGIGDAARRMGVDPTQLWTSKPFVASDSIISTATPLGCMLGVPMARGGGRSSGPVPADVPGHERRSTEPGVTGRLKPGLQRSDHAGRDPAVDPGYNANR